MPIRTAASPRAWTMKGEATWKAPSAAAPLISVRRLNFGLKVCGVMIFSPAGRRVSSCRHGERSQAIQNCGAHVDCLASLAMTVSIFALPGALSHGAPSRCISDRPLYLAAGALHRSGGFFAWKGVAYREHIVRIALGRMRFADKHGAHQFVVAGAILRRARLQGDLRWQLESRKRARESWGLERLLLIGNHRQCLDRRIAEPVTRRRRATGNFLDRGTEFRDMRHARLVPPPFHGPPSDPRAIGHGANAFQFEQGAADGHLLVEAELNKLFQARDLIAATHDIDEHLRAIGLGLDQVSRIIRRAQRDEGAGGGAARGLQDLFKAGLDRMAIGVVRRQEIPLLAELFDQG